MKTISLDFSKASQFVKDSTLAEMQNKAVEAQKTLKRAHVPGTISSDGFIFLLQ